MPGSELPALFTTALTRSWYQWWLAVSLNTKTRVRLRGGLSRLW